MRPQRSLRALPRARGQPRAAPGCPRIASAPWIAGAIAHAIHGADGSARSDQYLRRARDHSPRHTGGRFSANAAAPSIASLEPKTRAAISACLAHAWAAGQSADSTMMRLVAASAIGALAAIAAARMLAAARASPAGTSRLIRPALCSLAAGIRLPVRAIFMAMLQRILRGS